MTHRITRITGDVQLPVTLEQAKAHLRVTDDAEDELLNAYLYAAVEWVEEETHRAVTRRTYLVVDDKFPSGAWTLPLGKIQSVESVQYIDTAGATQTWDASPQEYELDNDSDSAARLKPKPDFAWPDVGIYLSSARISLTAGFTITDLPYSLHQAILMRLGQLHEGRAPGDPELDAMENATRMLLKRWTLPVWA